MHFDIESDFVDESNFNIIDSTSIKLMNVGLSMEHQVPELHCQNLCHTHHAGEMIGEGEGWGWRGREGEGERERERERG